MAPVVGLGIDSGSATSATADTVLETNASGTTSYAALWGGVAGNLRIKGQMVSAVPGTTSQPQIFSESISMTKIKWNFFIDISKLRAGCARRTRIRRRG
jgi:hypothetical protein